MIRYHIEKVIAELGLTNYTVTHKAAKLTDLPLFFAKDVIIVHSLNICISRAQAQDQSLSTLIRLGSPERTIIYDRNIFKVTEIDPNGIQLHSDLISEHHTDIGFKPIAALSIYSGHIMYYQIHNKNA